MKKYIGTRVAIGGGGILLRFNPDGVTVDKDGKEFDYPESVLSDIEVYLEQDTEETITVSETTTTAAPTTTEQPTTTEEITTTEEVTTTEATTTEAPEEEEDSQESDTDEEKPKTTRKGRKKAASKE